ncbi:methyl-accepting chemotaxis protein [Enterococcus sp. LJL98]
MKTSIIKKITSFVVLIVFTSIALLGSLTLFFSYRQTLSAAGVELTSCANITTGIIGAKDLMKVLEGDPEATLIVNQQIEWTIEHKPIFATNYILALDGTIIASDSHLADIGRSTGDQVELSEEALAQLQAGHTYHTGLYTVNGQERQTGYAPIYRDHNPKNELIAINAIDFEGALIRQRIWETNQATLLLTILLPLTVALLTFLFIKKTMAPIQALQAHVQELASGNLTSDDLVIQQQDELGQLATGFNQMRRELKQLICEMEASATTTNESAQELLASSEQTQQATQVIAKAFAETEMLINEQSTLTAQADSELTEMSQQVQSMTEKIHRSTTTATETANFAHSGHQVVEQTLTQLDKIHTNTTEANQISETLNQKAQEINQVMTLITHISNQTNLLALNASIEAARAQEHGAGFLVVAEEVRELSVQTKEAAEQVSGLIQELQANATHSLTKGQEGHTIVKQGVQLIHQTKEAFAQISSNAMKTAEQSQALSLETETIKKRMLDLVDEVQNITTLAKQVTENSQQTSETSQEQTIVMGELVEVSRGLSILAEQLRFHIKKFQL